jgi:hypothetical protein
MSVSRKRSGSFREEGFTPRTDSYARREKGAERIGGCAYCKHAGKSVACLSGRFSNPRLSSPRTRTLIVCLTWPSSSLSVTRSTSIHTKLQKAERAERGVPEVVRNLTVTQKDPLKSAVSLNVNVKSNWRRFWDAPLAKELQNGIHSYLQI